MDNFDPCLFAKETFRMLDDISYRDALENFINSDIFKDRLTVNEKIDLINYWVQNILLVHREISNKNILNLFCTIPIANTAKGIELWKEYIRDRLIPFLNNEE